MTVTKTDENQWSVTVQEDEDGELFITLPTELLNQMGWDFGDEIEWEPLCKGHFSLKKKEKDEG